MAWHAYAIPGLLVFVLGWSLAFAIFFANPSRLQNRLLALVLAVESTGVGTFFGLIPLVDPATAWSLRGVEFTFQISGGLLYLAFLGTIDSPLSRPFRSSAVRRVLFGLVAAVFLAWPLLSPIFLGDTWGPQRAFPPGTVLRAAPGAHAVDLALAVILFYGLAVALHAWRRAPRGTQARAQARAYGTAFGVRDLVIGVAIAGTTVIPGEVFWYMPTLAELAFFGLLGYGILKTQLFDIDLKIKWTLSRGTVAMAFLLVFFVVSQLIERLASEKLGYVSGAAAAGVLLLAINPLQKTADKLADKAMPKTEATPAYVAFRKMEVYKAAVEEVLADGKVSEKDRRVLDRLRTQLGLAASDAGSMERDISALRGAT